MGDAMSPIYFDTIKAVAVKRPVKSNPLVEWRRVSPARRGPGRAIPRFAVLDHRRRIETNRQQKIGKSHESKEFSKENQERKIPEGL
jgi:ethanolamine ammonia-lyase small subunit